MTSVVRPLTEFPQRWTDKDGKPLAVMAGPVKGYLMMRRPGAMPFVLALADLLDWKKGGHPSGPFKAVGKRSRGNV